MHPRTYHSDGIDRSRYVYEGPNGTPRDRRDYSPNERMRVPLVIPTTKPHLLPVEKEWSPYPVAKEQK